MLGLHVTRINYAKSYTTGYEGATTYISSIHVDAFANLLLFAEGKINYLG